MLRDSEHLRKSRELSITATRRFHPYSEGTMQEARHAPGESDSILLHVVQANVVMRRGSRSAPTKLLDEIRPRSQSNTNQRRK